MLFIITIFVNDVRVQANGPKLTDRESILELFGTAAGIVIDNCAHPSVTLDIQQAHLRPCYVHICEAMSMCAVIDDFTRRLPNSDQPGSQGLSSCCVFFA